MIAETVLPRRRDVIRVAAPPADLPLLDYATLMTPRRMRLAVVDAVARQHGVAMADIMGRNRTAKIAAARAAAMRAIDLEFGDSSTQIGRLFGRHHTAVLQALGRIGARK